MIGELLIIITGFFRWLMKGGKTDLSDEINGASEQEENNRAKNYLIGVIVFFLAILLLAVF